VISACVCGQHVAEGRDQFSLAIGLAERAKALALQILSVNLWVADAHTSKKKLTNFLFLNFAMWAPLRGALGRRGKLCCSEWCEAFRSFYRESRSHSA